MKMMMHILVLAVFLVGPARAMSPDQQQRPDIDALVQRLQLDQAGAEKLKGIMQKHRQQMESRRGQAREQGDSKREHQVIRDKHEEELLTVLNYEQLYKFKKYMRQFHPRRHQRGDKQQEPSQ